MDEEKIIHVDLRPIGSDRHPPDDLRALIPPDDLRALIPPHLRAAPPDDPPDDTPPPRPTDEGDHGVFFIALLANAIVFALIGMTRLAWNVAEEGLFYEHCSSCGFQGFVILDKSMPYFAAFAVFAIAAGVWRRS